MATLLFAGCDESFPAAEWRRMIATERCEEKASRVGRLFLIDQTAWTAFASLWYY
jgi:hypothetical protein